MYTIYACDRSLIVHRDGCYHIRESSVTSKRNKWYIPGIATWRDVEGPIEFITRRPILSGQAGLENGRLRTV